MAGCRNLEYLLAPLTVEEFVSNHLERETAVVHGRSADRFDHALTLAQVEQAVFDGSVRGDSLQVLREGPVDRAEYLYPSGLVDSVALGRLFEDGHSIVLPHAHERIPSLTRLVRGLEAELGCRVQTNVYLSPPGAAAFAPHYDTHDVLVLQAHGSKDWTIFEGPGTGPPPRPFDDQIDEPGSVRRQFVLSRGDLCYLPRGVMHRAVAVDDVSLHVTVGIHWVRAVDVLKRAIDLAVERQPGWLGALPLWWWHDSAAVAQLEGALRPLVTGLLANGLDPALASLREEFVATRQPLVAGHFEQLRRLDALEASSIVGARDPLVVDLVERDDQVVVSCFGSEIAFPQEIRPVLERILVSGGATMVLSELTGELSLDEVMVLVRRLVREGLAFVDEPDSGRSGPDDGPAQRGAIG